MYTFWDRVASSMYILHCMSAYYNNETCSQSLVQSPEDEIIFSHNCQTEYKQEKLHDNKCSMPLRKRQKGLQQDHLPELLL